MDFRILGPLEVRNESGAVALGRHQAAGGAGRAAAARQRAGARRAAGARAVGRGGAGQRGRRPCRCTSRGCARRSATPDALDDDAGRLPPARAPGRARRRALRARSSRTGGARWPPGGAEHAAAVLREALALWRGPPLADLAFEPFAQAEIARLEEQRLRRARGARRGRPRRRPARRARRRAAPARRRPPDARAARRPAHARALPLRAAGRRARGVPRDARSVLVAEIGVEPGPELRRLQEAILRQDAALELAGCRSRAAARARRRRAPAARRARGRARRGCAALWSARATGSGALVALTGARGIGKTRLAAELAGEVHRLGATVAVRRRGAARRRASCSRCVGRATATRPTLLVVDDADRAAADVLGGARASWRRPRRRARCSCSRPASTASALGAPRRGRRARARAARRRGGARDRRAATPPPGRRGGARRAAAAGQRRRSAPRPRGRARSGRGARRRAGSRRSPAVPRPAARELRSMEIELAGDVVELQAARERVVAGRRPRGPRWCARSRGWRPSSVADAEYFFGRERLVAELVARLVGAPLLAVVGPSGSGKSSVLRAGLLPALAERRAARQRGLDAGGHPAGRAPAARARRRAGARSAAERRFVLAVDQFEETFTACRDEDERAAFVAELVRVAQTATGAASSCSPSARTTTGAAPRIRELSGLLAANHVLVGPMRRDELRRGDRAPGAARRPARRAGAHGRARGGRRGRARRPAAAVDGAARALAAARRPTPASRGLRAHRRRARRRRAARRGRPSRSSIPTRSRRRAQRR